MSPSLPLVAYEHQRLVVVSKNRPARDGELAISQEAWEDLARFASRSDAPPFSVQHQAIRLGQWVGYLEVGRVRIEVLPKLTQSSQADWRRLLILMLREVYDLRLTPMPQASLSSNAGSLYDVLIDHFLVCCRALLREGLSTAYRDVEGEEPALRGRLLVHQQVRRVARPQRLCVAFSVLDADTLPNRALVRALERVAGAAPSVTRRNAAAALLADFPEVAPGVVTADDFSRLRLDRRTRRYGEAVELARLILLAERPDLRWSGAPVIALLFDMNFLFEGYVLRQLRRISGLTVHAQSTRVFWDGARVGRKLARPDLVVHTPGLGGPVVIDTKWKSLPDGRPDDADLRQLFAYLLTFSSTRGILVYPRASSTQLPVTGLFTHGGLRGDVACHTTTGVGSPGPGGISRDVAG